MRTFQQSQLRVPRLTPLAACFAGMFALTAPAAMATTWTVNTCSEGSAGTGTTGSLRYAVSTAVNGDTIDMAGLSCSTISLVSGAIVINQPNLTLNGPGMTHLTITGTGEVDRIIDHEGTAVLNIYNLSLAYGHRLNSVGAANGGCVYSKGSVNLSGVSMSTCNARAPNHDAQGGAVFATNALTIASTIIARNNVYGGTASGGGVFVGGDFTSSYSNVENNTATAPSGTASGGGVFVGGDFTSNYSSIENNTATTHSGGAIGGGLRLSGNVTILASTISGNQSNGSGGVGGIAIGNSSSPPTNLAVITNSTISGNSANAVGGIVGGMFSYIGTTLQNSTIAFNTANSGSSGGNYFAPGLAFTLYIPIPPATGPTVNLQSTLISNNTYGVSSRETDFSYYSNGMVTISGSDNLIRAVARGSTVPDGTIETTACPLLGPLRNNGGPTKTHALLSHSPAIDMGNDNARIHGSPYPYDQRGSPRGSPYARVSHGQADIGAYELDQTDIVFNDGFESCPSIIHSLP